MANVMAAFASRAPGARGCRVSLAGCGGMKSFAPVRSQLTRRQAARIASDIRYLVRTIRGHRKGADVTLAPAPRVASLTLRPTEPPSPSAPQPEPLNFFR